MKKESNIRILWNDRKILGKIARKEGRTLKVMFSIIIKKHFEDLKNKEVQV